jgi:hypothetical protein
VSNSAELCASELGSKFITELYNIKDNGLDTQVKKFFQDIEISKITTKYDRLYHN